jgi:site-specific DNA-methyltransferase (adenine-specific)
MMEANNIVLGDTLTVLYSLPNNSFDVGVTSPPYNKGERDKGWLVDKVIYDTAIDRKDEAKYQQEQIDVLNELYRVIKPAGSFFYNHKLRWVRGWMIHPYQWISKTKWCIRQEIIWHRKIAGNIRGWRFWQVDERIYWLYKPADGGESEPIGKELKPRHAKLTSIWEIRPENKIDWVPDPFPLALPTRCIYSVMDERKGLVIDPYTGSGTTLVAAKLLGHEFLGIEISEEYRRKALERISNAEFERKRLLEELELHKVELTFKERKERGLTKPRRHAQKAKAKQGQLLEI